MQPSGPVKNFTLGGAAGWILYLGHQEWGGERWRASRHSHDLRGGEVKGMPDVQQPKHGSCQWETAVCGLAAPKHDGLTGTGRTTRTTPRISEVARLGGPVFLTCSSLIWLLLWGPPLKTTRRTSNNNECSHWAQGFAYVITFSLNNNIVKEE